MKSTRQNDHLVDNLGTYKSVFNDFDHRESTCDDSIESVDSLLALDFSLYAYIKQVIQRGFHVSQSMFQKYLVWVIFVICIFLGPCNFVMYKILYTAYGVSDKTDLIQTIYHSIVYKTLIEACVRSHTLRASPFSPFFLNISKVTTILNTMFMICRTMELILLAKQSICCMYYSEQPHCNT